MDNMSTMNEMLGMSNTSSMSIFSYMIYSKSKNKKGLENDKL